MYSDSNVFCILHEIFVEKLHDNSRYGKLAADKSIWNKEG